MKIEKLTKIKNEYATIPPGNFQLMEKINEIIDTVNNITEQPKEEIDGFDAELNALLKKYEYLPKEELQEPLEFYLDVIKNDLDVVRGNKKQCDDKNIMQMLQSIYEILVSINNKNTHVQVIPYTPQPLGPYYDTAKPYCNTINKIDDDE